MSAIGFPSASAFKEAKERFRPASDPDDPHVWSVELRDYDDLANLKTGMVLRWYCTRCMMEVTADASVNLNVMKADPDGMRDRIVRLLFKQAKDVGDTLHPKCSELATVREVMES